MHAGMSAQTLWKYILRMDAASREALVIRILENSVGGVIGSVADVIFACLLAKPWRNVTLLAK